MININSLKFSYNKQNIININSFSIKSDQHIFLYGNSGSGKSTFLNLLCGILETNNGKIEILNQDLNKLTTQQKDQFRANNFGVIFQQFNLIPYLSIEENIALSIYASKQKYKKVKNIKQTIKTLLLRLKLDIPLDTLAYNLSIGQQQRVAIARALIGNPKIILADEPTSALDSNSKKYFMQLLLDVVQEQNSTLIFVSHDKSLIKYFDQTYNFSDINKV